MNADKNSAGTPNPEYIDLAVEVFSMLAEPTRVRIIVAKLRLARIVASRQEGQRIFYSLANEHAPQLVADALFQAEHAIDENPAHHRKS